QDLHAFYQKYYGAKNMVGALVGNFKVEEAKKILEKYFTSLPPGQRIEKKNLKQAQNKKLVQIKRKASPLWMMGFYRPGIDDPHDYALDLIEDRLCSGPSSQLYRRLVLEKNLAQNVDCYTSSPGARGEGLFLVMVRPFHKVSFDLLKKEFFKLLAELREKGFSKEDLKIAKKKLKSSFYYDLQSNESLADALSYYEILGLGWKYLRNYEESLSSLDASEVNQAFKRYFREDNSVEARLLPQ
ncbi:MAG: insulinase family protein, partial [Deltaproteobacteria bacterium]|nr:insulinase family protein [Deltaproteobacteria bacterium]